MDNGVKASSRIGKEAVFVLALGGVTICAAFVFRWHDTPERFPSTDYRYGLIIGIALCGLGACMRRPVAQPAVREQPDPKR